MQRTTQLPARQFHHAEPGHRRDLHAPRVARERAAQCLRHTVAPPPIPHGHKVDGDNPAEIAQAQLARRLSRGILIERRGEALAGDPWGVQIAPMSRFGVVELSRGQLRRPLHELLCDATGATSAETEALAALRSVEHEVRAARGRLAAAHMGADLMAWLDAAPFDWRAALTARIGPRWDVRADARIAPRSWRVEVE
jgi:hypothetical protein